MSKVVDLKKAAEDILKEEKEKHVKAYEKWLEEKKRMITHAPEDIQFYLEDDF